MVLLEEFFSPEKIQSFMKFVKDMEQLSLTQELSDDMKAFLNHKNVKGFMEVASHLSPAVLNDAKAMASMVANSVVTTALNDMKSNNPCHKYIRETIIHRFQKKFLKNFKAVMGRALRTVIRNEFGSKNGNDGNDGNDNNSCKSSEHKRYDYNLNSRDNKRIRNAIKDEKKTTNSCERVEHGLRKEEKIVEKVVKEEIPPIEILTNEIPVEQNIVKVVENGTAPVKIVKTEISVEKAEVCVEKVEARAEKIHEVVKKKINKNKIIIYNNVADNNDVAKIDYRIGKDDCGDIHQKLYSKKYEGMVLTGYG